VSKAEKSLVFQAETVTTVVQVLQTEVQERKMYTGQDIHPMQGVIENLPAFGRFPSIILYPMDMMEMS
jgi:hypothetical protein